MSDHTKIEWTEASWNPVTGCTKVSQGCKNCYAERITERFGQTFTDIQLHPERLDLPLHWRKPRRIFVNSMSDLFHEKVPREFIAECFAVMGECPRHTFQVLTKRAERMKAIMEDLVVFGGNPPSHIWLGVSVENQETADERIPLLLQTPAAVRFVSYEPALGPVTFPAKALCPCSCYAGRPRNPHPDCAGQPTIDWIIAGGESGPHARPAHPDWFRSVRDQCQTAGVAFFFKQRGEWTWEGDGECQGIVCRRGAVTGFHALTRDDWERVAQDHASHVDCKPYAIGRVGKKRAGRLLDGREWNEYPAPPSA